MASGIIPKYADGADTGWIDLTPHKSGTPPTPYFDIGTNGALKYRRIGKTVTIVGTTINPHSAWSSGSSRRLYTGIPEEARPPIHAIGFGGNKDKYIMIQSTSDGNLNIYRNANDSWTTSDNIHFVLTYLAA